METMNSLLALSSVATVIAFGIFYPSYVERSRGCSVFKLGRMVMIGGIELVTLATWDHPTSWVLMLMLFVITLVVFILNKRDATSWWHGILMTLWQSLVFIAVIFILIDLSNTLKRWKERS